jgi:lipoate-protein ligase A
MGLDEALLRRAADEGVATLRFYTWQGPWLSLGYAQRRVEAERLAAWQAAGVGVVRRTTGGRAVLHGNDLTYSIAAPQEALRPGLRESYDQVATALLAAIRQLGARDATRVPVAKGTSEQPAFDCFAAPAGDEIMIGAEKLVGSAQRRMRGAVLQHGSIRVAADDPDVQLAAGIDADVSVALHEAGIAPRESELREALRASFEGVLETRLEPGEVSATEVAHAQKRVELHRLDPLSAPRSRDL